METSKTGKAGNIALLKWLGIAVAVLGPIIMGIRIFMASQNPALNSRDSWVRDAAMRHMDAIALNSLIIAVVCIVVGIVMIIVARNLKRDNVKKDK